jgi:DNA-binding GntR family transcriptional regulator
LRRKKIGKDELRRLENIHKQYISSLKKENLAAAIRKDVEFHEAIYNASGNNKLVGVAGNLREQIYRFRVIYMKDFSNAEDVLKEHEQILKSIEEGNCEEAGRLAEEHIIHQQRSIIERM